MDKRDIRFAAPKAPREQRVLFPHYLDEVVGEEDPVRGLEAVLEEVDWTEWEAAYAGSGQPPIHPRYLAGAILWGLLHKITSSRALERAGRKDLDFIWLLEGHTPDHSTFVNFRVRHMEAIKGLQAQFAEKLVKRKEQALLHLIIDGTRFRADSGRQGARSATWIAGLVEELEKRLHALEAGDAAEAAVETACFEGMAPPAEPEGAGNGGPEAARLKKKLEASQKALDIARERDAKTRKHNGERAKPARVPVTDPESQILPNKEGGFAPNYTPTAAVDAETGAIVHAEVLEGANEADDVLPAVAAAEKLTGEKVASVLADSNFAAGAVLEALEKNGTEAYMPTRSASPPDNPARRPDPAAPVAEQDRGRLPRTGKGKLTRLAFVYDAEADAYYCPMGKALRPHRHGKDQHGVPYTEYRCADCSGCPLFAECVTGSKQTYRTIRRDVHEPWREAADRRMATPEGRELYSGRAPAIEGVFGLIKAVLGIRRFTVRGLKKVRAEWNWICTAYNLKKLLALQARSVLGGPENEIFPAKAG